MSRYSIIQNEVNSNKEQRLEKLRHSNQILETNLNYLEALKQHYQEHWLDVEIKHYEAQTNAKANKTKFSSLQKGYKKIDDLYRRLLSQDELLDENIKSTEARLAQFQKLDPVKLTEYRNLMDDLELQETLIEFSKTNMSPVNRR